MGKNNKIACIHITRNDVRIVEGRVSSGVILISHSAIVQKAGRFFSGDRLANMSDLVSAIVTSMTMNSITAKELYIVYDNNLQVDFFLDEKLIAKKENKRSASERRKIQTTVTRHLPKTSVLSSTKKNGANSSLRRERSVIHDHEN